MEDEMKVARIMMIRLILIGIVVIIGQWKIAQFNEFHENIINYYVYYFISADHRATSLLQMVLYTNMCTSLNGGAEIIHMVKYVSQIHLSGDFTLRINT